LLDLENAGRFHLESIENVKVDSFTAVFQAKFDALPSQPSGRAVGIISHIDEVKKAVGKRIEVTRNPGEATSTVEIMN